MNATIEKTDKAVIAKVEGVQTRDQALILLLEGMLAILTNAKPEVIERPKLIETVTSLFPKPRNGGA